MIRVVTPPTPPAITAHDSSTSVDTIKNPQHNIYMHSPLLQVHIVSLNLSLEVSPLLTAGVVATVISLAVVLRATPLLEAVVTTILDVAILSVV